MFAVISLRISSENGTFILGGVVLHERLVGMAICDTQSDPNQISTCKSNSDKNIVDPTVSPNHPGTAFMEMQFYPPGWASFNIGVSGTSCDPTKKRKLSMKGSETGIVSGNPLFRRWKPNPLQQLQNSSRSHYSQVEEFVTLL